MKVRAKFRVTSVTLGETQPGAAMTTVQLAPVHGPGNEEWSKWTPSGEIRMTITNPSAAEEFKPGKVFFVDFTEVEGA